jgi:RNA polymerase sigma-70 factor, ECF subfamily
MATSFQGVMENAILFAPAAERQKAEYSEIYNEHCDRIYSLAFYVTDNELTAEQLATNTFLRAFSSATTPCTEHIDQAFLAEVRELTPVGVLTLNSSASSELKSIRGNIKRVHLERAVVQLPITEKLVFLMHDVDGYQHSKIGRLLGISEEESRLALHQARVQIRQTVAEMI